MSNQSVIIKSNRYGLIVILDEKPDWETIKKEVAEKFSASAKFFGFFQYDYPALGLLRSPDRRHDSGRACAQHHNVCRKPDCVVLLRRRFRFQTARCHRKELPDPGGLPGG